MTRSVRLRRIAALTAVSGLLLVPALAGAAAALPREPGPSHHGGARGVPSDADLQRVLDDVVAAGATGVVLQVDDGRRTTRLAAGVRRLEPARPMTLDPAVRAGSVTKTVVATLVLQQVGEGRVRLDDTVEEWLPGLVPGGDGITLAQLLDHASGLFDVVKDEEFFRDVFTDPLREYTPEQLVRIATAHPPLFEPGEGWGYSSTGYVLLGMVLERATGRSVARLVREWISEPLRLDRTSLPRRSPDLPAGAAHGYVPPSLTGDGYRDLSRISPTALGAGGALVSTPRELRRFYRALLGGRLLEPRLLARMRHTVEARPGYDYGLGLYRQRTACGDVWGHDGNAPGYETYAWNDRTGRRGFVLTVTTQPDDVIEPRLEQALTTAACRMLGRRP